MRFFLDFTFFLNILTVVTIFGKETYIPDASLSVPKIIKRHGYPAETHIVDTKDGYLLEVHRIPYGKNAKQSKNFPVLLQHGIVASSADWIINGPSKALAYQLADQGYDVWLGNSRGNTYSRTHINRSPQNEEFWNFSFHEMGIYDMPATIDYILERTNRSQLNYIGHSMGTCIFFVMCSVLPEYNYKIRVQISLAPVAYIHHMTSTLNSLAPYANQIEKASNWISHGAFLPQNAASKLVNKYLCGEDASNSLLCKKYIVYKLFGEDSVQFDMSLLPIILGHNPAGTSVKTLMHFAQEIRTKNFQQFDHGKEENIKIYNCSHPPKYNLSNVIAPVAFYYAQNDIIADPKDVIELYSHLPNRLGLNLIEFDQFNHVDFLYSKNIIDMVYQSVLNTISTTEFEDWVPVFDNTTIYNAIDNIHCNDIELRERNSRKTNKGFWSKLTGYIKKKEVSPLVNIKEQHSEKTAESRNTYTKAWKELFNE
ncbi:Partial AB-hydrolase lipase domain,Serine aminopeptidase, S33,Alpha/Beta hydrolase fold [Cinara cedri]|uniref:Partial AB-hydrolase lipase domain,Serine aminopeptidase, S33,Alpha/Beta hydrolase fold n=1 Tax=Cinara cedri TaxID=506608 RepID=A0A5E4M0C0_9HEMI|nr:Partial AB-hydrolase lipase domain,Serine aminopeptidase, S33,Alpha/Beta hydrolase fold [Cinara cedri]